MNETNQCNQTKQFCGVKWVVEERERDLKLKRGERGGVSDRKGFVLFCFLFFFFAVVLFVVLVFNG